MGKSGRHKKLNRQEKAKTQLKGGVKKLLKAQNVVNPTLKVKRIVIREQLTDAPEGQETTRRRQTLHELLSTLHHHNTNLRKDALIGMHELVVSHPIVLRQNLDKILERVAALTSDLEGVVRKENLKFAESVFQRVTDTEVGSFWSIILTHLKCTLTHLSPSVRYGTLPFLQLLITYFPRLVVGSISTVLSSLLGLISSSQTSTTTQLKVEISAHHGDISERLTVYSLIGACLDLYNNPEEDQSLSKNDLTFQKSNGNEDNENQTISPTSTSFFTRNPTGNNTFGQDLKYLGLYYPQGYETLGSTSRSGFCSSDIFEFSSTKEDDEEFWTKFVQSCVACLTQSWVEVGPSSGNDGPAAAPKKVLKDGKVIANKDKIDGKAKQKDFNTTKGCDKSVGNGFMMANGNHLNSGAVDTLKSLVTLMAKLLLHKNQSGRANFKMESLRNEGDNLTKYFLNHLPFVAIQDNNKRTLTTLNLQLFLLAAHLRLLTPDLRRKFEILVNELIDGRLVDGEQSDLILRFLCCDDPNSLTTCSLPTDFICCILSIKDQRREMCKFLWRVLRPDNRNAEELILLTKLDWDTVTPKLLSSFTRLSTKLLNLLTHIAIREECSVKPHLMRKMDWFQDQLEATSPSGIWNECIRLFWYSGALPEFKEAMQNKIPRELIDPLLLQ